MSSVVVVIKASCSELGDDIMMTMAQKPSPMGKEALLRHSQDLFVDGSCHNTVFPAIVLW